MQKESTYYNEFLRNLPQDLAALQSLQQWYCSTLEQVQYMLSNDTAVYTLTFGNEFGRISRLFLSAVTTGLMEYWLRDYFHRLCGEKLVIETRISELQLIERQQRYN